MQGPSYDDIIMREYNEDMHKNTSTKETHFGVNLNVTMNMMVELLQCHLWRTHIERYDCKNIQIYIAVHI